MIERLEKVLACHFLAFSLALLFPFVCTSAPQARTLGPWSSAVELVNARQAAIDERNSKLQQQAEKEGMC